EFTRLCVPRLLRHSRQPFEIIFVDAGSLDGTAEFLAGVAAAALIHVGVVHTPSELALPLACQQGVAQAHGPFIVLLSNDVLVREGWLNHLVALARMFPDMGMVGPMSNYAEAPQWVGRLPYRLRRKKVSEFAAEGMAKDSTLDLDPVDQFAREWRGQKPREWDGTENPHRYFFLLEC